MIFYFSATGNSKYVAQRLAGATGERLVFLRDAVRSRAYHYDLGRQERLGFRSEERRVGKECRL